MAPSRQEREASVHPEPRGVPERNKAPSVRDRLGDNTDARAILDARWRHKEDGAARSYHPRRGRCNDSEEDRSPSPEPLGTRVFSEAIRRARFLAQFRQSANIVKYSRERNLDVWLADYRLACQLGSVDDDLLIIRNLPLFLADLVRAWLEHLPPWRIRDWADLV
jgi:hypothetical protein